MSTSLKKGSDVRILEINGKKFRVIEPGIWHRGYGFHENYAQKRVYPDDSGIETKDDNFIMSSFSERSFNHQELVEIKENVFPEINASQLVVTIERSQRDQLGIRTDSFRYVFTKSSRS